MSMITKEPSVTIFLHLKKILFTESTDLAYIFLKLNQNPTTKKISS